MLIEEAWFGSCADCLHHCLIFSVYLKLFLKIKLVLKNENSCFNIRGEKKQNLTYENREILEPFVSLKKIQREKISKSNCKAWIEYVHQNSWRLLVEIPTTLLQTGYHICITTEFFSPNDSLFPPQQYLHIDTRMFVACKLWK